MVSSTMGDIALTGILATAIGSLLGLAVWAFGGGALLFVGGRFIAKSPEATYWRSVGTIVLAAIASSIILALASALSFGLLGPLGFVGVLAGIAAGLLVTWLIIKAMFGVSFGKAILAWLPTLAMAVIVLPIVGLLAAVLVPTLQRANEMTNRTVCMSNLSSINKYIIIYKGENDGKWPADFQTLITQYQVSPQMFTCPCVSGGIRPVGRSYDYFYFPPNSDDAPQTIVACDFAGNHRDGSRSVLFTSGCIKLVKPAAFQAELTKPENAAFADAMWQAEGMPATAPAGRE